MGKKIFETLFCKTSGFSPSPKSHAYYRELINGVTGKAKSALKTLVEFVNLSKGGNYFDAFYLALAHQKLGNTKGAQAHYNNTLRMPGKQPPADGELRQLRLEAAAVFGEKQNGKK